jgi:hypothetical protein
VNLLPRRAGGSLDRRKIGFGFVIRKIRVV